MISYSILFLSFHLIQDNPLANIKKVDCALLPPCRQTLEMKVRRTQYVATIWTRACDAYPAEGMSPVDYGWETKEEVLVPKWFEGSAIPEKLFSDHQEDVEDDQTTEDIEGGVLDEPNNPEDVSSDEVWTEDSESERDD